MRKIQTGRCSRRPCGRGQGASRQRTRAATAEHKPASVAPLTKADLVGYLSNGCKPRNKWRIGTEHEKLAFNFKDGTRAGYAEIQHVLDRLVSRFGWEAMTEEGKIIGCKMNGQSVTLEPGGQFELSGAPLSNLHQTCDEVNSHLYQAKAISEEVGVGFLGVGFDPKWTTQDVPIMPKNRYNIMRNYMPKVGTLGLDMMLRSCTIQVNLDFESEQDMIDKFRIGLALQPISTALFAMSPFRDGKPTGYLSWRSHVWTDVDADRCGTLPWVWEDDFGFDRYVEYALDVPMYFAYRKGQYLDATGCSFRDFINGELPVCPGEVANIDDWEAHLTTIFPEVRLKRYIEMRGADGGPWNMICALPALWVGLLYSKESQAKCLDLIQGWTQDDRDYLRNEVARTGLDTPFKGGKVQDLALQVLAIAREGLEARGLDETKFLDKLDDIAQTNMTGSAKMLKLYETDWNQSVDPIYANRKLVF